MTELRDLLLSLADPPVAEPAPVADLERRQRRRKRKRIAVRAAPVTVCLLVLAGAVTSIDRDAPPAAGPEPGPDVAVTVAPPTSPSTTAVADPSACRNSYNASCGPFRWDPAPPEVPIQVSVTYEPAAPRVGESVTFTVSARRSAGLVRPSVVDTGDGGSPRAEIGLSCGQPGEGVRYGPWDLPPAQPFEHTSPYLWTYQSPGSYTARFAFEPWSCGMYGPVYPGQGEASVTVTVTVQR